MDGGRHFLILAVNQGMVVLVLLSGNPSKSLQAVLLSALTEKVSWCFRKNEHASHEDDSPGIADD